MTTPEDDRGLEVLSEAECWHFVRSQSVGRFASNRRGRGPHVVPINYAVEDDDSIVFRSGAGTKLESLHSGVITIQVDVIDHAHRTGTSVIIEGHGRWLYEEQDPSAVEAWAPGDRAYVVRVQPTRITGRRIELHQRDTDHRGYR